MVFTTLKFIVFFASLFFTYYLIQKKYQWFLLLLGSYFFYSQASIYYLLFLIFTTIISFSFPIFISIAQKNYIKKTLLFFCIFLLLLPLIVFKYSNFILQIVSNIFNFEYVLLDLILPIGLSFYIFQSMGYCIDVYRGQSDPEKNIFKHALYVSYFPQLLQGPIGDYNLLKPQLFAEHVFCYKNSKDGLIRIMWGFFKKLVVANHISILTNYAYNNYSNYSGIFFWIFIFSLYAIELYADFSGYMDISIGCSEMLGIKIKENFNLPYFSKNIAEFWRKWHITLGKWFRNYVFYSLLRTNILNLIRRTLKKYNKYLSNTIPTVLSLLIVWTLIGLWHGADWCYVVYGLYHGVIIIFSTIMLPIYNIFNNRFNTIMKSKIFIFFQIFRTFIIIVFGYFIFMPANLFITKTIFINSLKSIGIRQIIEYVKILRKETIIVFTSILVLFLIDLFKYLKHDILITDYIEKLSTIKRWIIYLALIFTVITFGDFGTNTFIYFGF